MSEPHPKPIKSETLGLGSMSQYFLNATGEFNVQPVVRVSDLVPFHHLTVRKQMA